jgi:uncharacterized protein YciI
MYFALLYDVVDDYVRRRQPFRAEHLALAERFRADGKLLSAGAFDPPDGALLIFRCEAAAEVEEFVRQDPYAKNALVARCRIREWKVVVGEPTPG